MARLHQNPIFQSHNRIFLQSLPRSSHLKPTAATKNCAGWINWGNPCLLDSPECPGHRKKSSRQAKESAAALTKLSSALLNATATKQHGCGQARIEAWTPGPDSDLHLISGDDCKILMEHDGRKGRTDLERRISALLVQSRWMVIQPSPR